MKEKKYATFYSVSYMNLHALNIHKKLYVYFCMQKKKIREILYEVNGFCLTLSISYKCNDFRTNEKFTINAAK